MEREHPGSLDAIPWFWRRFARSSVKIAVLHRTVPAALPQDDLAEMWRLERRMLVSLVLFFGVLFILLAGSRAFQWRWGRPAGGTAVRLPRAGLKHTSWRTAATSFERRDVWGAVVPCAAAVEADRSVK